MFRERQVQKLLSQSHFGRFRRFWRRGREKHPPKIDFEKNLIARGLDTHLANQFTTGDSSYATKPVIERYTDYVAQYDYVAQGANSVVHILSLIDIDGNKIALNGNTNFNYGMIKTIFPASSPVSLVDLTINSTTSGSAIISSSIDENNIYVYGGINKIDVGLLVPANFNPYIDVYDVARKAKLI